MKISYMKKRENFYKINQSTLDKFYNEKTKAKKLFIYPHLNAIVTGSPSKAVTDYLFAEYNVGGNKIKRSLAKMYTKVVINSKGCLSNGSCRFNGSFNDSMMIYPCNKKIRVFDFEKGEVRVLVKDGFMADGLLRELEFRRTHNADFILPITSSADEEYTEKIIDGRSIVRSGDDYSALRDKAWEIWKSYVGGGKKICACNYVITLRERFRSMINGLNKPTLDLSSLENLEAEIHKILSDSDVEIEVCMSHGDLQPGNIWVESGSEKIYIIDWESVSERSASYDYYALYKDLRRTDGLLSIADERSVTSSVVLYEDMIYRIEDLSMLPGDVGSAELNLYAKNVLRKIKNV